MWSNRSKKRERFHNRNAWCLSPIGNNYKQTCPVYNKVITWVTTWAVTGIDWESYHTWSLNLEVLSAIGNYFPSLERKWFIVYQLTFGSSAKGTGLLSQSAPTANYPPTFRKDKCLSRGLHLNFREVLVGVYASGNSFVPFCEEIVMYLSTLCYLFNVAHIQFSTRIHFWWVVPEIMLKW